MLNLDNIHQTLQLEIQQALSQGEVPIAALVILNNRIIAKAHNQSITLNDPTAHAEILALRKAGVFLGNYRLEHCEMWVSLEPCLMCQAAIQHARIQKVHYLCTQTQCHTKVANSSVQWLKRGDIKGVSYQLHHDNQVQKTYEKVLDDFFKSKRDKATTS